MNTEFSRRVRSGSNYSALISFTADNDGLADQRWIEQFFDRDEERIHVDVADQPLHHLLAWQKEIADGSGIK